MKKFEYKIIISEGGLPIVEDFNAAGEEGWKLVSSGGSYNCFWLFMRPKQRKFAPLPVEPIKPIKPGPCPKCNYYRKQKIHKCFECGEDLKK